MKFTVRLMEVAYPWKIRIPWKAPSPIIQRKLAKEKNYEEKPKYMGKPPATAAAKALLKRPLGRPSVKSRVIDLRVTHSRDAYTDFIIHRSHDFVTGVENRENISACSQAGRREPTHMVTLPLTKESIRSRITDIHHEMLKHDKTIEHMLSSTGYISFLPLQLLTNSQFDIPFLEDALLKLLQENVTWDDPFKVRVHGLKTFHKGRTLVASLTADLGMRLLYRLQRRVLLDLEKKRRFLRSDSGSEDFSVLENVHRMNLTENEWVHPCWQFIVPLINPFDHFQPHITVASSMKAQNDRAARLPNEYVPYPAYAPFINEYFGDEHVTQLELRSISPMDSVGRTTGCAHLKRISSSKRSYWLANEVRENLPVDLITRSSVTTSQRKDVH